MGIKTVGMTGMNNILDQYVDHCISVPSNKTPIIQEVHELLYHFICQEVERYFV